MGVAYLIILVAVALVLYSTTKYLKLLKTNTVYLRLKGPADLDIARTAQLFNALHGLKSSSLALEIVSTPEAGISFIARVPKAMAPDFKRTIQAYSPDIEIEETNDYLSAKTYSVVKLARFKLRRGPQRSLKTSSRAADPLNYLIAAMSDLNDTELIALQLVISPLQRSISVLGLLVNTLAWLNRLILGWLTGSYPMARRHPGELKESKPAQKLFEASLRAVYLNDRVGPHAKAKLNALSAALSTLDKPGYQRLVKAKPLFQSYSLWQFKQRLPALIFKRRFLLSSTELAALYHLPGALGFSETLTNTSARTIPLPQVLTSARQPDVFLGENHHHGRVLPIGLNKAERARHLLVLGSTGSGKTTLLKQAITQDIKASKGVAVIDPHGDLAESLLGYIPKSRLKDVIYFNPADVSHPIGINLLEMPQSLSGDELLLEQDFITEACVSLLRKLFSDNEAGGHRLEYVLRNAIHTAFLTEHPTIFTVYRLLSDEAYRSVVISKIQDKTLLSFWRSEYQRAGSFQRVKLSIGVTAKLGRFLRSAATRRVLIQPKSSIDFDEIINEGKILICNFSKGLVGEDTASLLGGSVLTKLQLAAYKRQRLAARLRRPFYLYIDEFQNFANKSFDQLLSEARKYGICLTLAEQSIAQQEDLSNISRLLANVGSLVCFRCSSPLDEKVLLPLFKPALSSGELLNLPAYSFYMRLTAVKAYPPFSGETVLVRSGSKALAEQAVEASRRNYALPAVKGLARAP